MHVESDNTHVDETEASRAMDPFVGDGTPDEAPEVLYEDSEFQPQKFWAPPTRKWLARTIVAVSGLAVEIATTDGWDKADTVMTITVVSAAMVSYVTGNDSDPGGVRK